MKTTQIIWLAVPALLVGLVLGVAVGRSRTPFGISGLDASQDSEIVSALGEPTPSISVAELKTLLDGQARLQLIDVREPDEYSALHISGAVSLPLGALWNRQGEILRDRAVVVYCMSDIRGEIAARELTKLGFANVRYLDGGISAWQNAGLPIVR